MLTIKILNVFKYGRDALSLRLLYDIIPFLNKKFDIIQCHFGPIGNTGVLLKQLGIEGDVDIKTAHQVVEQVIKVIGIDTEVIESSPNKITMKVSACPVFNAGAAIGMDPAIIEEGCQAGAMAFMTAIVKQLNPNMSIRLAKFRESPDKCCLEEIVLEA